MHNTQPWRIELHPTTLQIRADRSRQLTALDPRGRELVQSVGAALFNARVALAADGWASDVDRLPRPDDPDLLAVVRPVRRRPDPALAALAPAVTRRRTNRRRFTGAHLPDAVLRRLTEIAESEGVLLVPVVDEAHRRLVARLTQQADGLQNADPAYRAELRHWTTSGRRRTATGCRPTSSRTSTAGSTTTSRCATSTPAEPGSCPPETHSDIDQTMVLARHPHRRPELAWLRAGEALQHVLLELTRLGWVASPLTQAIEVPLTRTQLRGALTWDAHPQMLLRIAKGACTPAPRAARSAVPPASHVPTTGDRIVRAEQHPDQGPKA